MLRDERIESSPKVFLNQSQLVQFGVERAEREAKAALPAGGTMAGTRVATLFGEGGQSAVLKGNGLRFGLSGDRDGDRGLLVAGPHADGG